MAKENNGTWERLSEEDTKITTLDGPALCFANHGASGITELRTGKVIKERTDEHGMWNYSKLVYNSKFPWESTVREDVESQQYVIGYIDKNTDAIDIIPGIDISGVLKANATFWHGEKNGVLYRRQFFDYELGTETHWRTAMNLADFAVPYGIIRADKIRMYRRPLFITLGAFGFPDNGTDIEYRKDGAYKAVILKGYDHSGKEKQLCYTIFDGWDDIDIINSMGTNPDSFRSIVLFARTTREKQYGYEKYFLLSQVITKESHEDFEDDEIFPISDIEYADPQGCGGYGPVTLHLKSGVTKVIDFYGIEGDLEL